MTRAEFEKLALEHLDACYRLALQLTRHPDEATDLVQEVFLRALRNADKRGFTESGGGIRSWLFTITHNTFYSRVAKRARSPSLAESLDGAPSSDPGPGQPPPAWDLASLDWEQVDDRLKKAIDALSPEHREVLLLWGVEGMKYKEIAELLAVPIGTVMSRLHRSRAALAISLEGLREELGWKNGGQRSTPMPSPEHAP